MYSPPRPSHAGQNGERMLTTANKAQSRATATLLRSLRRMNMPDSGSHVCPAYASEVEAGCFDRAFVRRSGRGTTFAPACSSTRRYSLNAGTGRRQRPQLKRQHRGRSAELPALRPSRSGCPRFDSYVCNQHGARSRAPALPHPSHLPGSYFMAILPTKSTRLFRVMRIHYYYAERDSFPPALLARRGRRLHPTVCREASAASTQRRRRALRPGLGAAPRGVR
jgi:hypothetical protein